MDKRALIQTKCCFDGNYQDLINYLDRVEAPDHVIKHWRESVHSDLCETSRLFLNFLASVQALVDHTRHYIEANYSEEEQFRILYEKEKGARVANVPLRKFVQDLRGYTLHWELPIMTATASIIEIHEGSSGSFTGKMEAKIALNTSRLLQWDGWTSLSKKYIRQHPEEIVIRELSCEYYELISQFFQWMHEEELKHLGYVPTRTDPQ